MSTHQSQHVLLTSTLSVKCSPDLHMWMSCSPDPHIVIQCSPKRYIYVMIFLNPHMYQVLLIPIHQCHVLLISIYQCRVSWCPCMSVMFCWSSHICHVLLIFTYVSCSPDSHTSASCSHELYHSGDRLVWSDLHTSMSHDCYTWFSTFMNTTDIQCTLFI